MLSFKQHFPVNDCPPPSLPDPNTFIKLMSILLEFLKHSSEQEKAYNVLINIKKYLANVPQSLELNEFVQRVGEVQEYLLHSNEYSVHDDSKDYFNFNLPDVSKTTIVINSPLPGFRQAACRSTFAKLVQSALSVYQDVSQNPQCVATDASSLLVPEGFPRPQEPLKFQILYPKSLKRPNKQAPVDFLDIVKKFLPNNPGSNNPYSPKKDFGPDSLPDNPFDALIHNNPKPNPFDPKDVIIGTTDSKELPSTESKKSFGDLLVTLAVPDPTKSPYDDIISKLLEPAPEYPFNVNPENSPFKPNHNPNDQDRRDIWDTLDLVAPSKKPLDQEALDTLTKNLQHWLTVPNYNKLPSIANNGFIELTYMLKRPKPVIYHPVYYVKYRVPYKTFVQNFRDLILKKPELKYQPAKLYQALLVLSNVTQVSPDLKGIGKNEVLKLVFSNGALIDAKLVKGPQDSYLSEQLKLIKNLNSDVNPEQVGLSALNWLNKSKLNKLLANDLNLQGYNLENGGYVGVSQGATVDPSLLPIIKALQKELAPGVSLGSGGAYANGPSVYQKLVSNLKPGEVPVSPNFPQAPQANAPNSLKLEYRGDYPKQFLHDWAVNNLFQRKQET